jgi:aryl-alcohol dehydrogenase-like predicted oxidoreductase
MKKRKIGNSGLKVFSIGLGTMGMSEFYGKTDEAASIKTLHAALNHGVDFIDTADIYGIGGHNEKLLNKAFHNRWDKLVLATKFGIVRNQDTGERLGLSGKPAYVKQSCENSLKRLGRDNIDLYYLHRVDPDTPIEETVGAMAELVKAGKVRYIGLSEVSGETLRRANAVHPITAVQSEYSMWSVDIEETTLPVSRELGTSLVAYSPLGRGFLTGRFKKFEDLEADDFRRMLPRFQGDNFQKNLELVEAVREIAADKNCTLSQIALSWLLHKGKDIIPIPGTTRIENLLENIKAADIKLSAENLSNIDSIMKVISGTRYPEASMKMINK